MPASPKPAKGSAPQVGEAFAWKAFQVPPELVERATLVLVAMAVLLSGLAWLFEAGAGDRQIAGVQRAIASLEAEASVLQREWQDGALPARTLQAEAEHIADERDQQQSQLAELSKEPSGG